jgi:25S rRNA (uracil2634-N3)-methyltransferase
VKHITATCYDNEETLYQKYPQAEQILLRLLSADPAAAKLALSVEEDSEWQGLSPSVSDARSPTPSSPPIAPKTLQSQKVASSNLHKIAHYAINATKLSTTHSKLLRAHSPFTKIVFNFPHVGGLSTDVNRQVRANQELLVGFFKSAIPLLVSVERPVPTERGNNGYGDHDDSEMDDSEGSHSEPGFKNTERTVVSKGQILVTLFEGEPYTLWNIRDLARHCGLKVVESFRFPWEAYPRYTHARTIGEITRGKDRTAEKKRKGAWRGEERDARCFVLEVKEEQGSSKRNSDGTEANNVELGVRKEKKRTASRADSESGSD